jgi:hypothetical protein
MRPLWWIQTFCDQEKERRDSAKAEYRWQSALSILIKVKASEEIGDLKASQAVPICKVAAKARRAVCYKV